MNYSEQIKSPKWQMKRNEILNLKGYKCEQCGDTETQLHVHHRFYIKGRKIHEYDNDVLQVLCENCHSAVHAKKEIDENVTIISKMFIDLPSYHREGCMLILKSIIDIDTNHYDGIIDRLFNVLSSDYNVFINYNIDAFDKVQIKQKIAELEHGISILLHNDEIGKMIKNDKKNNIPF